MAPARCYNRGMQLDRTYKPRRRRRGFARLWPLIALVVVGIVLYEQRPAWLISQPLAPTPVPTRSAVSFLADADIALKAGDFVRAIEAYNQVIRLEPDNAQPLAELSALYLLLQDLPKSLDMAERAVEHGPEEPRRVERACARPRLEW